MVGRQQIHLELQSFVLNGEADNSASGQKIRRLSHRQDAGTLYCLQEFCVALGLRAANESNLAISQFLVCVHPADFLAAAVDWRITSQLGQDCAEGEIAAHADDKRRPLGGKHSVRPIDKAWKRGQKVGLAAVFRRGRSEERRVGKECRSRWSPYH